MAKTRLKSRSKSKFKFKTKFMIFIFILLCLWACGFFLFYTFIIPHASQDDMIRENTDAQYENITHTDAIVVLTGGMGRINLGFNLLLKDYSNKMLISGVYHSNTVKTILKYILKYNNNYPESILKRISLGHDAQNTQGNAIEAKKWVAKNNFKSLRLVTAYYHMPRALMFFKNTMPHIKILTTPVYLHHKIKNLRVLELLSIEYSKYLFWKIYLTARKI